MEEKFEIQSPELNALFEALAKAQGELDKAEKNSKNPFFKSDYSDLTSVWTACREALSKNGLAVVQGIIPMNGQYFLSTTLGHTSGQWMRSFQPIISEKNNPQGFGSAQTYAKRYALAAIVGIVTGNDDDAEAAMDRYITPNQIAVINGLLEGDEDLKKTFFSWLNKEKLSGMNKIKQSQFEKVLKSLQQGRKHNGTKI